VEDCSAQQPLPRMSNNATNTHTSTAAYSHSCSLKCELRGCRSRILPRPSGLEDMGLCRAHSFHTNRSTKVIIMSSTFQRACSFGVPSSAQEREPEEFSLSSDQDSTRYTAAPPQDTTPRYAEAIYLPSRASGRRAAPRRGACAGAARHMQRHRGDNRAGAFGAQR
jgi:hypothetical protein